MRETISIRISENIMDCRNFILLYLDYQYSLEIFQGIEMNLSERVQMLLIPIGIQEILCIIIRYGNTVLH